jgi:regulatory protein
MIITDIRTTQKGRRSIYIDGAYYATLHPDAVAEFSLTVGAETDHTQLEEALARSREIMAHQKALRLLSSRNYTARRLEDKLSDQGGEAARAAVRRMEELGLVDDEAYAQRYAEQLYLGKYYAPKRILQALRHRGIPPEIASQVSDTFDREDNPRRAAEYIERKYPNLEDETVKKRAWAALQRLGYTSGEAKQALAIIGCREDDE